MADLTLIEDIQVLINLGVHPTVAATTVSNERARRASAPAPTGNPMNFIFELFLPRQGIGGITILYIIYCIVLLISYLN
jgi:hypothetical protein